MFTEFVGGFGKVLIANSGVWRAKTTEMAFCPRSMDRAAVDGIGFGLVLLVQ